MTKPLSREERINLPNTLLLDPVTKNAAAYNGIHRRITFQASPELVAFGLAKQYKEAPWNPALHTGGEWHPLPPWATAEVLKQCKLYWLRSGRETDAELRDMPHS
jgi:hypothetical protein